MKNIFHKTALLLIVLSQTACVNYEEKYKSQIEEIDSLKSRVEVLEKEMTSRAIATKEFEKDDKEFIKNFSEILPDTVDEQMAEKLNEFNYFASFKTLLTDTSAYYADETIKLYKRLCDLSSDLKKGSIEENKVGEYLQEEKIKTQNIINSIPLFDSLILEKSDIFEWARGLVNHSK